MVFNVASLNLRKYLLLEKLSTEEADHSEEEEISLKRGRDDNSENIEEVSEISGKNIPHDTCLKFSF